MTDNIQVDTGVETQVQPQETTQNAVVENTTATTPTPVTEFEVDGIGKVKVDDIKEWKQGYMRQSDYTRKTQEVSKQRQEINQALEVYNYLKANPQVAQQIANGQAVNTQGTPLQNINPYETKLQDVNSELASMKLDIEISRMKSQHPDFNEVTVLQFMDKENINNIETAYYALKGQGADNIEQQAYKKAQADLTEKIRQNGLATNTIITNDKPSDTNFGLSATQLAIAEKMGVSPEVYAKNIV